MLGQENRHDEERKTRMGRNPKRDFRRHPKATRGRRGTAALPSREALLKKGKPFIVVACDEPYFLDTYRTIRRDEKRKGRWTDADERYFTDAVDAWKDQ